MLDSIEHDAIVVSETSFQSTETYDIIYSNITFLNVLMFDEHLTSDEICADALRSYYVDYYLAQVNNGGFSQFVYNSRWSVRVVEFVSEGLKAMNAKKHLKLFKEGAKIVEQMGIDGLNAYLTSEYFGENPVRDRLNAPNAKFWKVDEQEDLIALNATWLRQHPKLIVLTIDRMYEEVHRRGRALPDREKRIAAARANEPRYIKIIRALCEVSGQELDRVTAGDPSYVHEGVQTLAWHFITDKGHHYMVALGETAMMFHGDTRDRICEIGIQNIPD